MKKSANKSPGQISGEESMKVAIADGQDRVIAGFELRPWTFRSGKKGFWGSTKKIDWETQKYYQIQTYVIEIGSKGQNEPTAEPGDKPGKQQSLLQKSVSA
jgi:uncharacterized protein (DUF2147 family)